MKEPLKVWIRNERQIEEAIINGEETQVVESDILPTPCGWGGCHLVQISNKDE